MAHIPIDEGYGYASDSSGEETASIIAVASTIDSYRYENGRRYHAYRDGSYWGANDEPNAAYEKVVHHLFLKVMNDKLHLAPVKDPKSIADLGTGTGLWAMDIADVFDDADVLGVDLSPVPYTTQPNVEFDVDDITAEWTHGRQFDFIHMRSLFGSIEDWPGLYRQCFENLESGGYIEQVEFSIVPYHSNGSPASDTLMYRWVELGTAYHKATGKTLFIAETMKGLMEDAGFVDVVETQVHFPMGPWSSDEEYKVLGKWYKKVWLTGMENWLLAACTRYLNWTPEDVHKFVQDSKKTIDDRTHRFYYNGHIVYGRKP